MRSTCRSSQAVRNALGRRAPETFPGVETKSTGDLLLDTGRRPGPGLREDRLPGRRPSPTTSASPGGPWPRPWRRRRPSTSSGRMRSAGAATGRTCRRRRSRSAPGVKVSAQAPALEGNAARSRPPGRPVLALPRRPRRQQGVAPRGARSHDPGGLRELGRGLGGDGAKPRRPVRRRPEGGVASRLPRGAGVRLGDAGRRRGGDPDRARAHGVRAIRPGRRPEPLRAPAGRAGRGLRRAAAGWASASGSRRRGGTTSSPRRPA